MRHLENTGLFILSGFFFLFFRKLDYFFVCAFLLCLCLCCTSYFAQSKRLHLVLCTAFIAAAFLIPELFLFFPAVFYVLLLDQYHVPALVCSVLYFYGNCCIKVLSFPHSLFFSFILFSNFYVFHNFYF